MAATIIKRYLIRSFFRQFLPLWIVLSLAFLLLESGDLLVAFTGSDNPLFFLAIFMALGFDTTLPAALIVSMVMVFARHKRDGEIEIIKTSGYNVRFLFYTVFRLSLVIFLIELLMTHFVMPEVRVFKKRLGWRNSLQSLVVTPSPGPDNLAIANMSISYKEFVDGKFSGVILKKFDDNGFTLEEYQAKEAEIYKGESGEIFIKLSEVVIIIRSKTDLETKNKEMVISLESFFADQSLTKPKYIRSSHLDLTADKPLREFLNRCVKSVTILFVSVLAASVGVMVNLRSTIAGVAVSIPLLLIYYFMDIFLKAVYEKASFPSLKSLTALYLLIYLFMCVFAIRRVPK